MPRENDVCDFLFSNINSQGEGERRVCGFARWRDIGYSRSSIVDFLPPLEFGRPGSLRSFMRTTAFTV